METNQENTADAESEQNEIPLGIRLSKEFQLAGKVVELKISDEGLSWKGEGQITGISVLWEDIITSYIGQVSRGPGVKVVPPSAKQEDRFTLHYIEHQKGNLLRHKHVTFVGRQEDCRESVQSLADKTGQGRPKRLLTIVNPIGGQKKGQQIYESLVGPLFALAGIDAELIVTERFRHAEEVVKTYDFTKVDGLIVSGGDGLMQEVLHALIPRYNEGVDINNSEVELNPVPVTLGALATGTGNGISAACQGCTDVETGALVAIKGKKQYLNVVSVHEYPGPLLGFSITTLGYGFWSDLLKNTDDLRWMKTMRYPYSIMKSLASKKREFYSEGEYLPAKRLETDVKSKLESNEEAGWVKFSGTFTSINAQIGYLHKVEGKSKFQWGQHGEGVNLLLEKDTGRFTYLAWLAKFAQMKADAFEAAHIEEHCVKAYRFKLVNSPDNKPETTETAKDDGKGQNEAAGGDNGAQAKEAMTEAEKKRDELEHLISFEGEFRRTEKKALDVRVQRKILQFYRQDFEL